MKEKKNVYVKLKIDKEVFPIPKEVGGGKLLSIIKDPLKLKNFIIVWAEKDCINGYSFSKSEMKKLSKKSWGKLVKGRERIIQAEFIKDYFMKSFSPEDLKKAKKSAEFWHIKISEPYRKKGIWPVIAQRQIKELLAHKYTHMALPFSWKKEETRTKAAIGKLAGKHGLVNLKKLGEFLKTRKKAKVV